MNFLVVSNKTLGINLLTLASVITNLFDPMCAYSCASGMKNNRGGKKICIKIKDGELQCTILKHMGNIMYDKKGLPSPPVEPWAMA